MRTDLSRISNYNSNAEKLEWWEEIDNMNHQLQKYISIISGETMHVTDFSRTLIYSKFDVIENILSQIEDRISFMKEYLKNEIKRGSDNV